MRSHPTAPAARHPRIATAIAAIAALATALPRPVSAHPEIEAQIAGLSREIEIAEPRADAGLFLQRGELFRVHEEWEPALADFARALAVDPSLAIAFCCRGRLFLDRGEPHRAIAELTAFLERSPGDPLGLALRARAHAILKEHAEADADYAAAFTRSENPSPQLVLEWADARLASGPTDDGKRRALATLDRGIERLGPVVTLQSRAIDLECERGNFDAALARIGLAMAAQGTSPLWLKRKAETLEAAGRPRQAADAYREALARLDALPEHRRSVRAFRAMRGEIRCDLDRVIASTDPETP